MTYRKTIAPILMGIDEAPQVRRAAGAIVKWADGEFTQLEGTLRIPEVRGLQFETLQAIPDRYKPGDLYYFAAGVAGALEGLYIWDSPPNWRRL